MKIIIVGGGIAGLTTYLYLRKHLPSSHSITIYESHQPRPKISDATGPNGNESFDLSALSESTAIVGGGLGIAPNGMRVLRDLDPVLHREVASQGFRAENFVFKAANGWTLGVSSTSDKTARKAGEEGDVCIASSRHGLWETISRYANDKEGQGVVKYRKVMSVERSEGNNKIQVRLADDAGNEEVDGADLVIGADGVKSVVRKALFAGETQYGPTYSGQSGVGGFLKAPIPPEIADRKAMVFEFGRNGFFGYSSGGPVSSQQLMWWSTYETSDLPESATVNAATIKAALLRRHKDWKDPILQNVVQQATVESIYPTWTLQKLPHWGEKGMVLLGDAAHAMDPTTGQGASQAFEDAQTFALLLAELLKVSSDGLQMTEGEVIDQSIRLFHQIRSPRVDSMVERGKKLASNKTTMGVVAAHFMYFFIWLLNKFPSIGKLMMGDVNKELNCWSAPDAIRKALGNDRNA